MMMKSLLVLCAGAFVPASALLMKSAEKDEGFVDMTKGFFKEVQHAFLKQAFEAVTGEMSDVKENVKSCSICCCFDCCTGLFGGDPLSAIRLAGAKLLVGMVPERVLHARFAYCKTTDAYREFKNEHKLAENMRRYVGRYADFGAASRAWSKASIGSNHKMANDKTSCLRQCGLTFEQYAYLKKNKGQFPADKRSEWVDLVKDNFVEEVVDEKTKLWVWAAEHKDRIPKFTGKSTGSAAIHGGGSQKADN